MTTSTNNNNWIPPPDAKVGQHFVNAINNERKLYKVIEILERVIGSEVIKFPEGVNGIASKVERIITFQNIVTKETFTTHSIKLDDLYSDYVKGIEGSTNHHSQQVDSKVNSTMPAGQEEEVFWKYLTKKTT